MPDQTFARKLELVDSELSSQYQNCDRWAVIVGISQYQSPTLNLQYADRDAEELYKFLLTPNGGGFQPDRIRKLTNQEATTGNITQALRSFLKKPAREDLVLIYFACHGSPDPDRPGNVYLITHDTDPNDIAGTALPMDDIDRALKGILHSEKVIILADTCHSAAIGGGIGGRRSIADDARLMNRFLQEISRSKGGVALLTSAEANEVSFEDTRWGGGHGVFTHYLLEGMRGAADRDGNGIVTIGELFEYVRDNVKQATGYRQHPSIGTNSYDRRLPVAIAPTATPKPPVGEHLDITLELALTAEEMAAGTERPIVTEQGGLVVKIPAGVSSGKRIRVRGKGRLDARTQQRGDLYLRVMQRNPDPPDEKIPAKPFIEEKVPAKSIIEDLGNGITLEMVQIPAGTFLMGSPASESGRSDDEGPQHQVTVPAFLMGKFAVTQAQWRSVAGLPKVNRDLDPDPSHFKGANRPVEQVSWEEAVEFCDRLSRKTGKPYRLPSEAEWEYACRAGTTTPFHFGDTLTPKQAKCKANLGTALIGIGMNLTGVGTGGETAKVGSYPPNDFGLYDMHGNVWEWCADHWHDSYEGAPIDGSAWVTGGDSSKRLLRGGSWLNPPAYCRSALRGRYVADPRFYSGFRVACAASWTS